MRMYVAVSRLLCCKKDHVVDNGCSWDATRVASTGALASKQVYVHICSDMHLHVQICTYMYHICPHYMPTYVHMCSSAYIYIYVHSISLFSLMGATRSLLRTHVSKSCSFSPMHGKTGLAGNPIRALHVYIYHLHVCHACQVHGHS